MNERQSEMLQRERVANRAKHWVRLVTACNSRCLFCLDSDTPRNAFLSVDEIKSTLDHGLAELGADKVILSGGEASLHPAFIELIQYAKQRGYERVQTVTNGFRFADARFLERALDAGLGEITFSLHGHTPALHDHLTQTPNAFRNLMKGMLRAIKDGRPIVNVDVVINRQNVAVIDKIVELCLAAGVNEFDLLHVIPQAAAFENRDQLFYDVREHLPVLQKVFRLNRHPGVTIWTNRFPVSFLEGLEDLIQDPHKMLDEVNGRRFQVRRYLDTGQPLDCRQPERCVHCFIEPFCTTMERIVADQNARRFDVWWLGEGVYRGEELPFGCRQLGLHVPNLAAAVTAPRPSAAGLYLKVDTPAQLPAALLVATPLTLVASSAEHLRCWLEEYPLPEGVGIVIELNRSTAPWLLSQRALLEREAQRLLVQQPSYEALREAAENDVRDPGTFFRALNVPTLRVSGLPACLAPGTVPARGARLLARDLFDPETGRIAVRPLAREHVVSHYRAKSTRCVDCAIQARCEGAHINMLRDQGLSLLTPLHVAHVPDELTPSARVADGREPEPVAVSLPGFAAVSVVSPDPMELIIAERLVRKKRRDELLARVERHS